MDELIPFNDFDESNVCVHIPLFSSFMDKMAPNGHVIESDRLLARAAVLEKEFRKRLMILTYAVGMLESKGWKVVRLAEGVYASHPQYNTESAVLEQIQALDLHLDNIGLELTTKLI